MRNISQHDLISREVHSGDTARTTYTSVWPAITGTLSGLSPRIVTTANGSDLFKRPARLCKPLPVKDSCSRDEFDMVEITEVEEEEELRAGDQTRGMQRVQ
jgi:hypothetical protein